MPEWRGFQIDLHPGVYRPAEDTDLLANALADCRAGRTLEVACGSGVIALELARLGHDVLGVDIDENAIANCRINARRNGLTNCEFAVADTFPSQDLAFDLLVSNPPYVPSGPIPAPCNLDAGPLGRTFIDRLIAESAEHLVDDGEVIFVQSSLNGLEKTLTGLQERFHAVHIVAESTIPLGPLFRARQAFYVEQGLLAAGQEVETLSVIRAAGPLATTAPTRPTTKGATLR